MSGESNGRTASVSDINRIDEKITRETGKLWEAHNSLSREVVKIASQNLQAEKDFSKMDETIKAVNKSIQKLNDAEIVKQTEAKTHRNILIFLIGVPSVVSAVMRIIDMLGIVK